MVGITIATLSDWAGESASSCRDHHDMVITSPFTREEGSGNTATSALRLCLECWHDQLQASSSALISPRVSCMSDLFLVMDTKLKEAVSATGGALGYDSIKSVQEIALPFFLQAHDVFVSLPTGYGTSLGYFGLATCRRFWQFVNENFTLHKYRRCCVSLDRSHEGLGRLSISTS